MTSSLVEAWIQHHGASPAIEQHLERRVREKARSGEPITPELIDVVGRGVVQEFASRGVPRALHDEHRIATELLMRWRREALAAEET